MNSICGTCVQSAKIGAALGDPKKIEEITKLSD